MIDQIFGASEPPDDPSGEAVGVTIGAAWHPVRARRVTIERLRNLTGGAIHPLFHDVGIPVI